MSRSVPSSSSPEDSKNSRDERRNKFSRNFVVFVSGHGLAVETHLGRVEVKNSRVVDNYGNGIKAKFVDGHFIIIDETLTFCKMANIAKQTFPQLITGIPSFSTYCGRVSVDFSRLSSFKVVIFFSMLMLKVSHLVCPRRHVIINRLLYHLIIQIGLIRDRFKWLLLSRFHSFDVLSCF